MNDFGKGRNDRFSSKPQWRERGKGGRNDRGRRFDDNRRSDRHEGGFKGDRREGGYKGRGDRRFNDDRRYKGDRRFNDRGFGDRRDGGYKGRRDRRNDRRDFDERDRRRAREPEIPDKVKAEDLDPEVMKELHSLNPDNARKVAQHLVMAGSYIDIDPEAAYAHARAAVDRASRIGIVRQAAALAAYSCGKYAEALREVRTVRRLMGTDEMRAVEADCLRGLGKPDKAIEVIGQTDISQMSVDEIAELVMVESGARADMQDFERGLLVINDFLDKATCDNEETLARVLEVKVDRLEELGRDEEADKVRDEIPVLADPVTIVDLEEVVDAETPWVHSDLRGSKNPLIDTCDVVIMDLDGVCFMGTNPIDHVAASLEKARKTNTKIAFLTNNATRAPQAVVDNLANFDIAADVSEVMTSGMDGVALLKENLPPQAKVLVIGTEQLVDLVKDAGFEVVTSADDKPAAVLQGLDKTMDWQRLSEAAYAINNGATFIATNMDASLPTERGFALGNGALVDAVSHATGKEPLAGGKPLPGIYKRTLEKMGASRPLCVGDRLNTDIRGAKAAGLRSLHVLTGVSTARDVALAFREERPDFLGLDMRSLHQPSPGPVKNPTGKWTVGDSAGFEVNNEGVIYREDEALPQDRDDTVTLTLNDYRALVAAVWEAKDNRQFVHVPQINVIDNKAFDPDSPTPDVDGYDEDGEDSDE